MDKFISSYPRGKRTYEDVIGDVTDNPILGQPGPSRPIIVSNTDGSKKYWSKSIIRFNIASLRIFF